MNDRTDNTTGGELIALSLSEFLNIFFRGRWLVLAVTILGLIAGLLYGVVTKPLYRGTVQVRPGIVTYSAQGDPIRGWALKDVVQWFDTRRFWMDMKQQDAFKDAKSAPVILAEFIPIGMQWTPGGNIITLSNLSRSPEQSRLILEHAILSFNRQAMEDQNDSDIELALGRAKLLIEDYNNDIELLTGVEEATRVDIKSKQDKLKLIDAEAQRLEFERERVLDGKAWRQRAVKAATDDLVSARGRLTQGNQMLAVALANESSSDGPAVGPGSDQNPVTNILLSSARREQAGNVAALLESIGSLERYIFEGQVEVDTLNARIRSLDLSLTDLDLNKEVDLVQKREAILDEIARMEIKLNRELPHERTRLRNQLATQNMMIDKLEALEQISPIQVTSKPVRPRKLRAAVILTALAFFASLVLVLLREFYVRNRDVITAR